METPPKHKPHKSADDSDGSSSTTAAADPSSSSSSGSASSGSAATGASSGNYVSSATGSDASSGGSASGSASDSSGGFGVNSSNSATDLAGSPARRSSLIFVGVAAVAGVALAAAFVPKRKVEVSEHPLKGSLNKRINIFTHMAQHAKDPAARPPRRLDDEGATSYVNANEAMV